MADPIEDKGSLTERLEEDRQKMAIQVSELKKDYNIGNRLKGSVQKYPWPWVMGAVLTGFLFSRLPARRKEVYVWSHPSQRRSLREVHPPPVEKDESHAAHKIWFLVKPIISECCCRKRRPKLQDTSFEDYHRSTWRNAVGSQT